MGSSIARTSLRVTMKVIGRGRLAGIVVASLVVSLVACKSDRVSCPIAGPPFGDTFFERLDFAGTDPGSCPEGYPQGSFSIADVTTTPRSPEQGYTTIVRATSLELQCSVRIRIGLQDEGVLFKVGEVVQIIGQRTIRNIETDVIDTWVFRDSQGAILLASSRWTRPKVFDTDLLGFILEVDDNPVCYYGGTEPTLSIRLRHEQELCEADGLSIACCNLFSRNYQLRVDMALSRQAAPSPVVSIMLRDPSVIRWMSDSASILPNCP